MLLYTAAQGLLYTQSPRLVPRNQVTLNNKMCSYSTMEHTPGQGELTISHIQAPGSNITNSEEWRAYLGDEIQDGMKNGKEADRFHQYLAQFQNADMSVYVSNLAETGNGGLRMEISI